MAVVEQRTQPLHGNLVGYAEAGRRRGGPVVVLVHGIASRAAQWHDVMARLGDTCHVIAPDLLGPRPVGQAPRRLLARRARQRACATCSPTSATTASRSSATRLGGGIAMQFAYQFPERVERLALVNAGGLGPEVSPFLRAATLPGRRVRAAAARRRRWVRRAGAGAHDLLARAGVSLPAGLVEALRASARSATPPPARRSSTPPAASSTSAASASTPATGSTSPPDLPLLVVWGAQGRDHPGRARPGPRRRRPERPLRAVRVLRPLPAHDRARPAGPACCRLGRHHRGRPLDPSTRLDASGCARRARLTRAGAA